MTRIHIGVDLSKDWLDIYHPLHGHNRVANTAHGIHGYLSGLQPRDVLVLEATSGCDGLLIRLTSAAERPYHRLNSLHAWHFARSLNLPKTDRGDARMLARLGAERALDTPPAFQADKAELAELSNRRTQLKRMRTKEKHRLRKTFSAQIKADIRASLAALERRITRIEEAIEAFIAQTPRIARQLTLLETIPSIGRVTSVNLLAHMPELRQLDRRSIASLGGLAPRARVSGRWKGHRYTGDGRRHVRRALHMAAVSACVRASSPRCAPPTNTATSSSSPES